MAAVEHSPGFLKLVESVRPTVREVEVAEAQRRAAEGAILVDVREDGEWDAGHARGARIWAKRKHCHRLPLSSWYIDQRK